MIALVLNWRAIEKKTTELDKDSEDGHLVAKQVKREKKQFQQEGRVLPGVAPGETSLSPGRM